MAHMESWDLGASYEKLPYLDSHDELPVTCRAIFARRIGACSQSLHMDVKSL